MNGNGDSGLRAMFGLLIGVLMTLLTVIMIAETSGRIGNIGAFVLGTLAVIAFLDALIHIIKELRR